MSLVNGLSGWPKATASRVCSTDPGQPTSTTRLWFVSFFFDGRNNLSHLAAVSSGFIADTRGVLF